MGGFRRPLIFSYILGASFWGGSGLCCLLVQRKLGLCLQRSFFIGLLWFCLVFICSVIFGPQIDLFVLFLKEKAKFKIDDGGDELSNFYESSDFGGAGETVSKQGDFEKNLASKSENLDIGNKKNQVNPVTDLEEQFDKDSLEGSVIDKHSSDVLADAIRSIMDKDS